MHRGIFKGQLRHDLADTMPNNRTSYSEITLDDESPREDILLSSRHCAECESSIGNSVSATFAFESIIWGFENTRKIRWKRKIENRAVHIALHPRQKKFYLLLYRIKNWFRAFFEQNEFDFKLTLSIWAEREEIPFEFSYLLFTIFLFIPIYILIVFIIFLIVYCAYAMMKKLQHFSIRSV